MNNQIRNVSVLNDSPAGDGWREEWEIGAKTVAGARRSINRICCEWNAYFGQYDFVIVSVDGKRVSCVYSREVAE